jgi:hypothetical protein
MKNNRNHDGEKYRAEKRLGYEVTEVERSRRQDHKENRGRCLFPVHPVPLFSKINILEPWRSRICTAGSSGVKKLPP